MLKVYKILYGITGSEWKCSFVASTVVGVIYQSGWVCVASFVAILNRSPVALANKPHTCGWYMQVLLPSSMG